MANTFGGSNTGKAGLNITETDGSPDVFGVTKIVVSNGTLTDDVQFNSIEIDGNLNHDGSQIGFFGTAPATQQATNSATINPVAFDPAGSQLDPATATAIDDNFNELATAQQAILDLLTTYGLSS